MAQVTEVQQELYTQFERLRSGSAPAWLAELRERGMRAFDTVGFPTRSNEEWRFTPTAPIVETSFEPALTDPGHEAEVRSAVLAAVGSQGARLVFVNGVCSPTLSQLPDALPGMLLTTLRSGAESDEWLTTLGSLAPIDNQPFAALNTAFLHDGAVVRIGRGCAPPPIDLVLVSVAGAVPSACWPRILILVEAGAEGVVTETWLTVGDGPVFTNAVTEVRCDAGSRLHHHRMMLEGPAAIHVASTQFHLGEGAVVTSHNLTRGGRLVRNDIGAVLAGRRAECTLDGICLADGVQVVDNHTVIDHAAPDCSSHELYKSVLSGSSHGIFNGKIFVRQDAQKTDAKQTNQTLLLSDTARINTKPQLEIFADDVRCTHGATVGQLNEDAIFYLQARGIGHEDARRLLTWAFAAGVADRIASAEVRRRVMAVLDHHLPHGGADGVA
ncbi:MAG: Fe-S cluster assembly protein SufD [Armatimonadetes bacterium]|nr:Fe-S cluster assembly protein SufD [Armatimonadota bacterium]MDE2208024.1 Fe-S cluster assembly protein SufD [Armatimonadota bacterium]